MEYTNVLINSSESSEYCIKWLFLSVNVDVSLKLPSIFDSLKMVEVKTKYINIII